MYIHGVHLITSLSFFMFVLICVHEYYTGKVQPAYCPSSSFTPVCYMYVYVHKNCSNVTDV